MKIPIILLIFGFSFGTFFYANSNAFIGTPAPLSHPTLPEVLMQIEIRNSDGVLVSYIEPTVFYHNNMFLIHKHLDMYPRETIYIDGKSYEQFVIEKNYVDKYRGQRASISLWQDGHGVLTSRYDGFLGENGDLQTVTWKIIRDI